MTAKANPAVSAVSITTSDTTTYDFFRALYVGVSGDIKVAMQDGTTVTFVAVPIGVFPIAVTRIYATGTTATDIIGLR